MIKQALVLTEEPNTGLRAKIAEGTVYDADYVIERIKLPKDKSKIPHIIGWAGPARSGTSGMLFLLACQPVIDKAIYQPLKTIRSKGGPEFALDGGEKLICFKEVFRSPCRRNDNDPVETLLKAGVPKDKITWITLLRDPVQTYASWQKCLTFGKEPEDYRQAQLYTLELFDKYRQMGVNVTPFAYDLLALGERKVLKALFKKAKLSSLEDLKLDFDAESINEKVDMSVAADPQYFEDALRATLERYKFVYSQNNHPLDSGYAEKVKSLCQEDYDKFYELSKTELGL